VGKDELEGTPRSATRGSEHDRYITHEYLMVSLCSYELIQGIRRLGHVWMMPRPRAHTLACLASFACADLLSRLPASL
jgi:hypothetical protein